MYSLDWSNFEIADMDFWRSQTYTEYFDYLDSMGGFYYEVSRYLEVHTLLILSIALVLAALGRCTRSQHSRVSIFAQRSDTFLWRYRLHSQRLDSLSTGSAHLE
jgi:hypothetical protein